MNRKEMKNLAKKIAQIELLLRKSTDATEQQKLEADIYALTSHVSSLEEMMELDDMVISLLEEH